MDYQKKYREKRVTPQEAVKAVKPGAWVDYGLCVIHPRVLDRELARRMEQDPSLRDVNFRGGIALWQPEVTKSPMPRKGSPGIPGIAAALRGS